MNATINNTKRKPLLSSILVVILLSIAGCASTPPTIPCDMQKGTDPHARAESLRASLVAVADGHGNWGRYGAIHDRIEELGLEAFTRTEWIDWFSLQKNILIEIPGKTEETIYFVAHYDKTDMNPLKFASVLVNGLLDELAAVTFLGRGALDNATGVAVVLEMARAMRDAEPRYTYRFLLAGSEESGLRGSRAHVARLSREEKDAIVLAVNIDCVGLRSSPNSVTAGVSDPKHARRVFDTADRLGMELVEGVMPVGSSSDFAPFRETSFCKDLGRGFTFNLAAGLLPQRSWFTGRHSAPVLNFSAAELMDAGDLFAGLVFLPTGSIHGPRDRMGRIDLKRLYEQYAILHAYVGEMEKSRGAANRSGLHFVKRTQ